MEKSVRNLTVSSAFNRTYGTIILERLAPIHASPSHSHHLLITPLSVVAITAPSANRQGHHKIYGKLLNLAVQFYLFKFDGMTAASKVNSTEEITILVINISKPMINFLLYTILNGGLAYYTKQIKLVFKVIQPLQHDPPSCHLILQ